MEYRDRAGYEEQWWISAEALKAFRSAHGRWPVLTHASEEQLAVSRKNQRHRCENGSLRCARREWLDENISGGSTLEASPEALAPLDRLWQEHALALKAFRAH